MAFLVIDNLFLWLNQYGSPQSQHQHHLSPSFDLMAIKEREPNDITYAQTLTHSDHIVVYEPKVVGVGAFAITSMMISFSILKG